MEEKIHFMAELCKTDLHICCGFGKINSWSQLFETNNMSLVNVSLKCQTLISNICQYFLLKKCEKLLQCKSFSHFIQQKISVYLVTKS